MAMKSSQIRLLVSAAIVTISLWACPAAVAQDNDNVKTALFRDIEAVTAKARQEETPEFAPSLYEKAVKLCGRAESEYRDGESLEDIRETLRDALKAMNEAIEAAKISKITLAKTSTLRKEAARREFIKFAPSEFAKAESDYQAAIAKIEAGDVRAAREKADDAIEGYRDVIITALEDGSLEDARKRLDRSESAIGRDSFNRSKRSLDEVEDLLDGAHDREFEAPSFIADVRKKIDEIICIIDPAFCTPPDSLVMGSFVMKVESYDVGRQWDSERSVTTNASGVAWISFSCDGIGFFPVFHGIVTPVTKSFSVVATVRDALSEISLDEARLVQPDATIGESLKLDVPSKTSRTSDIIRAKKDLLDVLAKPKGTIKVRFENLTIEPTASLKVGKVLAGSAHYPTVSPVPDRISLHIAGFTLFIDTLLLAPTIATARAELEFPSSIADLKDCRPGYVDLGSVTITSSCQFHKDVPDGTYGPWVMENTGIIFEGEGFAVDFSKTWTAPGWSGTPPMLPEWRGVILKNGTTVSHQSIDTSNVGFLYGQYAFNDAIVVSSGFSAKLVLDTAHTYATLAPLEYILKLGSGYLQIENTTVTKGSFTVDGLLPSAVRAEAGGQFKIHFASFTIDSLLNTSGIVDAMNTKIVLSDYYAVAVKNGDFFLPAGPVSLSPVYFDKSAYDRNSIEGILDSLRLPGLTIHHRNFDSLCVTSRDARPPISVQRPHGWLNIVTQGGIGDLYVFGNPKEKVEIKCLLGQPGTPGYKSTGRFVTTFKDSVIVDFIHNAVYETYFTGNLTVPHPSGPVGVGVAIPFYDMGFTSIGSCVGGNPVFADTISLDYWGVGITSRWGVVSVRTGEILFTDALITEPRHFALGFNIYWGEMRADGNLGDFFFNYNSGNQKFDGFPFTIHGASLSRYTPATETAGGHTLLGYLEADGDVHFPFWGSRTVTIRDYKYPDVPDAPYNSRYVRITPSCFAVQRNWGSGRADMNFSVVCYDSSDQDGFNGTGQVRLLGQLDGLIPSTMDLNSIVTNICFCTGGFEGGAGGSITGVTMTGAMGDIRIGPVGGCIQVIGDKLERIYIEGPIELSGSAGWGGLDVSLQFYGSMVVEITPTSITFGTVSALAIDFTDVIGMQGMAGVKFTLATTGMAGDIFGMFNTYPVQIGAQGQFSVYIGFPPSPSFSVQGHAKIWIYFFGSGTKAEGAFLVALNTPRSDLWALDKIGKNITANTVLDGFGVGSDDRLTGFYGGGKFGGSISLIGIISGGLWVWGGGGSFFITNPPGFVLLGNAGIEITGEVLWGLLSASLWAELGGALGTGFSLCGAAGLDVCCCWDLICFGWSGSVCIGTGGISTN